ncbi:hypothetical protein N658DRAFT_339775 [Parathielavia hyrcaniae]|uniref:Uncharacterized protein n=1 Tax=Parathielavia hyrcaniae TaxID=113614 RepID=A0AAN6Q2U3_9PEZI|nr:hypothetical protein N658DRAFT_339775 [Parathielavia hyrcaniae]
MTTTVADVVHQAPANPVHNAGYLTQTDKQWARAYRPIQNLIVHTFVDNNGYTDARLTQGLHPWFLDDDVRMECPAVFPNPRTWRFETEADCELWFHTEISNVTLAAWREHREVTQSSHIKPPREVSISEEVDSTYTVKYLRNKTVLAIGEMKRNLIKPSRWQEGSLAGAANQLRLSQELRGHRLTKIKLSYADQYQCPQVLCFDGETLLLLQFRADRPEDIRDQNCAVDCWVFPRQSSLISLRYALYILLVQGLRRFQGIYALPLTVGGLAPLSRKFYNGVPVWQPGNGDVATEHPGGYSRTVDGDSGAVKWIHPDDAEYLVWETGAFWGEFAAE